MPTLKPAPPKVTAGLVRVSLITFHPMNTRRDLGDLRDLTASIRRLGILQPVTVEHWGKHLRLRAGHRRTAAARLAGLTHVPALIHAEPLYDDEFILQSLHENIVRRGLDHEDRARSIRALLDMGCSAAGIARDLGVNPSTLRNWIDNTAAAVPEPTASTAEPSAAEVPRDTTGHLAAGHTAQPATPPSRPPRTRTTIGIRPVRELLEQWETSAQDGLTAAQARDLLTQLRQLVDA